MNLGQTIRCRVDKNSMFVVNEKNKETKYDILGSEPAATPESK